MSPVGTATLSPLRSSQRAAQVSELSLYLLQPRISYIVPAPCARSVMVLHQSTTMSGDASAGSTRHGATLPRVSLCVRMPRIHRVELLCWPSCGERSASTSISVHPSHAVASADSAWWRIALTASSPLVAIKDVDLTTPLCRWCVSVLVEHRFLAFAWCSRSCHCRCRRCSESNSRYKAVRRRAVGRNFDARKLVRRGDLCKLAKAVSAHHIPFSRRRRRSTQMTQGRLLLRLLSLQCLEIL